MIVTVIKVTMAMTTMMSGWKIMIYQLVPCRGGTETFAHATETKPWWINFPFNVHHLRLIWASSIGESIFRSKKFWSLRQNLRRAAVVLASAIVIGIASVLKQRSSIQRWILASSSPWHHHLDIIISTSSSSWHHHHLDITQCARWDNVVILVQRPFFK